MGLAGPVWLPWCFACSGAPAKASFRFILELVLGALELKDEETVRRKQMARATNKKARGKGEKSKKSEGASGKSKKEEQDAWELRFEASFFSVQKETLRSGSCLLGTASVLQ